jgi:hypothetical protein
LHYLKHLRGTQTNPKRRPDVGAAEPPCLAATFAAELYTGSRLSHMVVVNRLEDGQIFIRDPAAGGSTYRMLMEEL